MPTAPQPTQVRDMPLSQLTDGIHLHTLLCSSESAFQRVTARLREQGILLEESAENS